MGYQTTNFPDWQLPNSRNGRFSRESGSKSCNFCQNSTKLSEKLKHYDKLKVTQKKLNFFINFFSGEAKN